MSRVRLISSAVLALLLVSGCGSVRSLVDGGDHGSLAYLASDPTGVLFVQWSSDDQGHLTGSGQLAEPQHSEGSEVSTTSFVLTGQRTDDDVNLTADFGLGMKQNWAGTVDGDLLTLQVPQDDGTLAPVSFTRSDVESFNVAVEDLRAIVVSERQLVADAEAEAAAEEAAAQARENLTKAMTGLADDAASMAAVPELEPMIEAAERALGAEQQALVAATESSCATRGESISAVGDAHSAVLDELSQLRSGISDLRYYAGEIDAGITDARAAGGKAGLDDYVDRLAAAHTRADDAETQLVAIDEGAGVLSDTAYALEYC